VRVAGNKL